MLRRFGKRLTAVTAVVCTTVILGAFATLTKLNAAEDVKKFEFVFGQNSSKDGAVSVTNVLYDEGADYGFMSVDSLVVNDDSVTGTADFRFKVNVSNGNYTVKVDTTAEIITSEVVESVSAVTGIEKTGAVFNVAVCDEVLDLTFPAEALVKSIEITKEADKEKREKPFLFAIGDSTAKNTADGARSWGNCVADGLVKLPDTFGGFENHGMGGRDSVNYYNQARVEAVLLNVCPGDYVTINMGINSRTGGEKNAYKTMISEYYVDAVIQRGAIPVIVTATPQGPVGKKASNYNADTGVFKVSRGNDARNSTLREIASEKELVILELGQWGEDWMNSLTQDDVTAYNEKYGTAYASIIEMVQSWYVDHNHYKEYLGIQIGNYIFGELDKLQAEKVPPVAEPETTEIPTESATSAEVETSSEILADLETTVADPVQEPTTPAVVAVNDAVSQVSVVTVLLYIAVAVVVLAAVIVVIVLVKNKKNK